MSQQGDDLTTVIITGCISLDIIGLGGGKEQVTGYCATLETYPYSSRALPWMGHGGTLWWGDTAQSNLRRAHVTHLLTHSACGTIMISPQLITVGHRPVEQSTLENTEKLYPSLFREKRNYLRVVSAINHQTLSSHVPVPCTMEKGLPFETSRVNGMTALAF